MWKKDRVGRRWLRFIVIYNGLQWIRSVILLMLGRRVWIWYHIDIDNRLLVQAASRQGHKWLLFPATTFWSKEIKLAIWWSPKIPINSPQRPQTSRAPPHNNMPSIKYPQGPYLESPFGKFLRILELVGSITVVTNIVLLYWLPIAVVVKMLSCWSLDRLSVPLLCTGTVSGTLAREGKELCTPFLSKSLNILMYHWFFFFSTISQTASLSSLSNSFPVGQCRTPSQSSASEMHTSFLEPKFRHGCLPTSSQISPVPYAVMDRR